MEVFHVSWNAPETVFHEMFLKEKFQDVSLRLETSKNSQENTCARVSILML